jgi:hypothetical protein
MPAVGCDPCSRGCPREGGRPRRTCVGRFSSPHPLTGRRLVDERWAGVALVDVMVEHPLHGVPSTRTLIPPRKPGSGADIQWRPSA